MQHFFAMVVPGLFGCLILVSFTVNAQRVPTVARKGFDFSLAGYHLGRELPSRDVAGKPVFKVEDYGAVPNDGKDDIDAIQRAVDAAEAAGGGVVLFPRGTFDFDVETKQRFVHIKSSHITIRGWGEGIEGTILHDHHGSRSPDSTKIWLGGTYPSFFKLGHSFEDVEKLNVAARVMPVAAGVSKLSVFEAGNLKPGVYILVQDNPADTSLVKELVFPLRNIGIGHTRTGIKFAQMVRVTDVVGNIATLEAPVHWRLDARWNPRLLAIPNLIVETGIENLRLVSDWKKPFIHHKNDEHDSGWDHIHISCLENGWIRNIVHDSPSTAVALKWTKNCVVYDCQVVGNRGHNGFNLSGGSTSNLLFKLKGGPAMHTFAMSGFCSGNVFHLCVSQPGSAIDCHGSLCHNNLFDNIYGAVVQNGGNKNALPPAHARGMVLYNFNSGVDNAYNFRIKTDLLQLRNYPGISIYGARSMPGYLLHVKDETGKKREIDFASPFGKVEKLNFNGSLRVSSLYTWQRQKRYGTPLPEESVSQSQP